MAIVGPNGRPIEARNPKVRGKDLCTVNQAINIAHNTAGPLALVLQEMMPKIARLEDHLGITDESIARPATKKERASRALRYLASIPRTLRGILTNGPIKGTTWHVLQKPPAPIVPDMEDESQPGPQFNAAELGDPTAIGGDVE